MDKILKLEYENPKTRVKSFGSMEIKNQTAGSADLYFYGDICSSTWELYQQEDMCPQDVSDFLNNLSGVQKINIYINSGGGSSFAGNAIYNILKRNSAEKTVYIEGIAASAASVIAMIGNPIVMPPGAQIMIHNAWTIALGNANDLRKTADTLDKVSASHIEIYSENAVEGVTMERFREMMDSETWLSGSQAAEVFKNIQVQGEEIAASLDNSFLSRYKHVPASILQTPKTPPADDSENVKMARAHAGALLAITR